MQNGVGGSRNSVHFSLNHAVGENDMGGWEGKKYGIILPFDKTLKANETGKFIEGSFIDLYTNGSVKIPEDPVIVRGNSLVPKGQYKVLNSEAIDEFKNLKGVKVVETSGNVHKDVNKILKMMGYTQKKGNGYSVWGNINKIDEIIKNKAKWNKFTESKGILTTIHTPTPACRSERMIDSIGFLTLKNSWQRTFKGQPINYQEQFLKVISELKKQKQYKMSFDIDSLRKIIKTSQTPQEALDRIYSELKLKPGRSLSEYKKERDQFIEQTLQAVSKEHPEYKDIFTKDFIDDFNTLKVVDRMVGVSQEFKKVAKATNNYCLKEKISPKDLKNIEEVSTNYYTNSTNGTLTIK